MEFWDVYDVEGNIIENRVIDRDSNDLKTGEYHLVTVGWIYNSSGQLLLQKRAAHKVYPLVYANHGGCALKGETSIESVIRELYEEIGIELYEEDLELLRSFHNHDSIFDEYITYKNIEIKDLTIDITEVESCQWFSLNEISELIDCGKCFDYKNNNPNGVSSFELLKKYIKER